MLGYKVSVGLSIASFGINPPTLPEKLSTTNRPWINILRQDTQSMLPNKFDIFNIIHHVFSELSHLLFLVTET